MMNHFIIIILSVITHAKSMGFETLVVGGQAATIEQFPHSVYMFVECYEKTTFMSRMFSCGGSLINQRLALTAAHCFGDCSKVNSFIVFAGNAEKNKGLMSTVQSYVYHKHYNFNDSLENDIAIVRLTTDVTFNDKTKRVIIMRNPPYREKAQVAGWGKFYEPFDVPSKMLYFVDQYVMTKKRCLRKIPNLSNGTICAESIDMKGYAARGDSGSALVVRGYIQIGIVSYKEPEISESLIVYTDTGYFYDWIKKNAMKLHCPD